MAKYILLGGKIHTAPDGGKAFCDELIKGLDKKPTKILDCLFGRDEESWDERFSRDKDFFEKHIPHSEVALAQPESFLKQIKNTDIIFFQGSRPEDMVQVLEKTGNWQSEMRDKVIAGSSGGASLFTKYFGVGKSTSGAPRLGEGLGIIPIKLIPHWESDYAEGLNINWDGLYEKLKVHKEDLDIITLREGEFKVFNI